MTFIDRYPPHLERAFSDAITEIVVARRPCPVRLDPGVGERRDAPRRPARHDRPRRHFRTLAIGFGASLARAEAEAILRGTRSLQRDARGLLRRRGSALRPPIEQDHVRRTARATSCTRARFAITRPGRVRGLGARPPRRAEDRRDADLAETSSCRSPRRRVHPEPRDRGERRALRPRRERRPRRGGAIFYLKSRGIPRAEAERLIVSGFFQEVLDRVTLDEVRQGAERRDPGRARRGVKLIARARLCDRRRRPERRGAAVRRRRPAGRGREPRRRRVPRDRRDLLARALLPGRGRRRRGDETIECPKHGSTFDLTSGSRGACRRSSRSPCSR